MRAFATKSPPLQRVTIILIVLSGLILALFAWFPAETLLDAARALDRTPPEPAPMTQISASMVFGIACFPLRGGRAGARR